ncbi:class A beta-lactamase [Pseudovibrio exalbescens]|uniref:class A beta-lactamase n=1 Tax=Pseudovibrio exalbescens TaxID=197461 RepID=UPI00236594F4|nr:class A beta-lactamase [Pseudovibrio exalbescens]MDD7909191.1 class A beta-lactamase [Pseudovibrio exalbescens]
MIARKKPLGLLAGVCLLVLSGFSASATGAKMEPSADDPLVRNFAAVEAELGNRVGAFVLDTGSGDVWSYRADERFPLNSTFKSFACAGLLAKVDAGEENLLRTIKIEKADLVTYSPITETFADKEPMSLGQLCHAMLTVSDNTAANMVLEATGGPRALTAFLRSIGDEVTRLDRYETRMNEATPGDPRDTTSPRAAATSLQKLLMGDVLEPASRAQLLDWMLANQVSSALLRDNLPERWQIADRSGAGGYGSRSVIAMIWPEKRDPIVVALYITGTDLSMEQRNDAIAKMGTAIFKRVQQQAN